MADYGKKLDFLIKQIKFPLAERQAKDWQVFPLFNGMIGSFKNFSSHISTLEPNILPHSPHSHMEEELIISLRGNVEILTSDVPAGPIHDALPLEPGSFVYHSPFQFHTMRCSSSEAAQYLVFKWQRRCSHAFREQGTFAHDVDVQDCTFQQVSDGFRLLPIDGLAYHTDGSLQTHLSCLEPGAGYPAHQDTYDMVAVLLEGELETFKLSTTAPAVFFFAANTSHGFFNPGTKPATYFVFEFNKPKQN